MQDNKTIWNFFQTYCENGDIIIHNIEYSFLTPPITETPISANESKNTIGDDIVSYKNLCCTRNYLSIFFHGDIPKFVIHYLHDFKSICQHNTVALKKNMKCFFRKITQVDSIYQCNTINEIVAKKVQKSLFDQYIEDEETKSKSHTSSFLNKNQNNIQEKSQRKVKNNSLLTVVEQEERDFVFHLGDTLFISDIEQKSIQKTESKFMYELEHALLISAVEQESLQTIGLDVFSFKYKKEVVMKCVKLKLQKNLEKFANHSKKITSNSLLIDSFKSATKDTKLPQQIIVELIDQKRVENNQLQFENDLCKEDISQLQQLLSK